MRNTPNVKAERYRNRAHAASMECAGTNAGSFIIQRATGFLYIVASDGAGWDHVSVHVDGRCPTWEEMCEVKELFFKDDEVVMQLHPAKSDYINCHQHTLHLWRPQTSTERAKIIAEFGHNPGLPDVDYPPIPLPSKVMV